MNIEEKLLELIEEKVRECVDEYYERENSILTKILEIDFNMRRSYTEINQRLIEVERDIKHHSIGVQNVYDKFLELEKLSKTDEWTKIANTLKKYNLDEMRKEVEEIKQYARSEHVVKIISGFNDFKENLINLLKIDLKIGIG